MSNSSYYTDSYFFPIAKEHLQVYQKVAIQVAEIWKSYGALDYCEFVSDDEHFEGTIPFSDVIELNENEIIVFGWISFPSKTIRDKAHQQVKNDKRMNEIVAPITTVFDSSRMVFGGFKKLL